MTDLLPDGADAVVDDIDPSDIRVDFSSEEAGSEARSFEPFPAGTYPAYITANTLRQSTSEKNPGKPYWNVEFTLDGEDQRCKDIGDRKIWGSVMLWAGAGYSLAQLMKALGYEIKPGTSFTVPPPDGIVGTGQRVLLVVSKKRDKWKEGKEAEENGGVSTGVVYFKNEIQGYKADDLNAVTAGSSSAGSGSLLP